MNKENRDRAEKVVSLHLDWLVCYSAGRNSLSKLAVEG